MNCKEFENQTEQWMEGVRSAEAHGHHLACDRCRALVEDLEAIRLAAPLLAEEVAPPERLWASIRGEIDHEMFVPQWMDGVRTAEAREHLTVCERCRNLVEDLDQIRAVAPQLARELAPPPRLWASIRAQLEREELIRQPSWWESLAGWFPAPSWRLAASTAAVLALAAVTIVLSGRNPRVQPKSPDWLSTDQPELASVDIQLNHVERRAIRSLHTDDPAVGDTLEQNLAIIDRQIALCEKTLEQTPADENTSDYLYDAYRQKADLLTMIAERSGVPTE
ncbi:MAG TPA: hypothetical protein VGS20_16400 [Candidatus Acidoferrales bacterium]|nr:hypothetical protein [Candidatus Acidoferrales bacterium]